MDKKDVLKSLAEIANEFDKQGAFKSANVVTDVMKRVSQTAWWQNEAGEPMYSPEAIRAEENYVPEYDPDVYNDRDDYGDVEAEARSEQFQDLYDLWASGQPDMKVVQQAYNDKLWADARADAAQHIEKMKNDPWKKHDFNEDQYLRNKYGVSDNPDLKDDLEQLILVQSPHRDWSGDPDTMHDVLDAVKQAILSGGDIKATIESVPAANTQGYAYQGPEDLGWDGGRED